MAADMEWPSQNGPVAIRDMTDSHLLAAIAWAERNAKRVRLGRALYLDMAGDSCSGEMAADSLHDAADRLYETEDPNEWWDEYRWLIDERERRGLHGR